jgi:hypothetical protein
MRLYFIKQNISKRERNMITGYTRKIILILQKKCREHIRSWIFGCRKDYPAEQKSALPIKKKKRNQKLTLEEKEYNKIHSKKRIVVEHAICRLKKYRIMGSIFRNRLKKYDKVSDIVSGLVNYRIMNPP